MKDHGDRPLFLESGRSTRLHCLDKLARMTLCLVPGVLSYFCSDNLYAHGGESGGTSLCNLQSQYCSATVALAACTRTLVLHPGGVCTPISARCDVGPIPHEAYTIRYQGQNHHAYK